ncbi:fungal specific transcription factor domain-containing protein [Nannizzia gypsea CBS 118893]|uniref:C6 finger domain transcription factor nscR n=1 Tax=Arthroderma gypseum (strain ATCC MYA-4604 / CBS 118893) TaxID=535722 RepID=E4UXV7_ARTGP|nr:fungal specific transcription factor domain-containing protein [Nannizzia gypsea CBS 118893]EFR02789.1 fungal specific transcription factor domain-containing protein [Nannizzia gypsea CBS 118893]
MATGYGAAHLISPSPSVYSEHADMTAKHTGPSPPFTSGFQLQSCLRCAHRKVRCDRVYPCSRCTKNDMPCEFPPPKTEKRRRKRPPPATLSTSASNEKLREKLKHYEEIFKGLGNYMESTGVANSSRPRDVADSPGSDVGVADTCVPKSHAPNKEVGNILVVNGKRSHYIEGNLWVMMKENLDTGTILRELSGDEDEDTEYTASANALALGRLPRTARIKDLYPEWLHFSSLWCTYLHNIQPVTMILHAPTVSIVLAEAVKGHTKVSKDTEALLFAVMACALMSLTDAECLRKFGEEKSKLLSGYLLGCEMALINANFLTSFNLVVLQSYMIYVLALSPDTDPHKLCNLMGIAKRSAQRLGLHQEISATGLSPFDLEMRRRLWYQIVIYDTISAHVAGLPIPEPSFEISLPSNVNETDLSPTMGEPPKERLGATDMIFCNLQYKIINLMHNVNHSRMSWALPGGMLTGSGATQSCCSEKEIFIKDVEKEIELDLLRYCDTLNPVHSLTATMARLTLCKLRFTMLHPSQYKSHLNNPAVEDRDLKFLMALRALEYENNALGQLCTQRFMWHIHQDFPWTCLVHILQDLKTRPQGELPDKAWEQIHMSYEFRKSLYQCRNQDVPLYVVINRMTVAAWRVRELWASEYGQVLETPRYIIMLQQQQQRIGYKRKTANPQLPFNVDAPKYQADRVLLQPSNFEQVAVDWSGESDPNIATSGLRVDMDVNFFHAIPNPSQDTTSLPMQACKNNSSQAQAMHPPFAWAKQGSSAWWTDANNSNPEAASRFKRNIYGQATLSTAESMTRTTPHFVQGGFVEPFTVHEANMDSSTENQRIQNFQQYAPDLSEEEQLSA